MYRGGAKRKGLRALLNPVGYSLAGSSGPKTGPFLRLAGLVPASLPFVLLYARKHAGKRYGTIPTNERHGSRLYRSLVHNAPDAIMILGEDFTVRYVNPSTTRMLGYPSEEIVGSKLSRFLPEGGDSERVLRYLLGKRGVSSGASESLQFRMRHADRSWRYLEASSTDLLDDPDVGGRVCYIRDITNRKARQDTYFHRAFHDPLTDLANRALFVDRLNHALHRSSRQPGPVAVLFVDLDDFKTVNDRFGHEAGDRLLVTVGRRLRACLRPADTAARLGGDEFAVLLDEAVSSETVVGVAERVVDALRAPVTVDGRMLVVTASVGVAVSDARQRSRARGLLRAADAAMYQAKASGKSNYVIFGEDARPTGAGWYPECHHEDHGGRKRQRGAREGTRAARLEEGGTDV